MISVVAERERVEERSAFGLELPIAGHRSFPSRFGGHGATRLCRPCALRVFAFSESDALIKGFFEFKFPGNQKLLFVAIVFEISPVIRNLKDH